VTATIIIRLQMRAYAFALVGCLAAGSALAQGRDTCPPPRPLGNATTIMLPGGYHAFVEAPVVYVTGGETWLIGKYGLAWRQEGDTLADARLMAGVALPPTGAARQIPMPAETTQLLAPALSPQPGGVGVFWGRMSDTVTQTRATMFFWSVYSGTTWTPPESLQASRELNWEPLARSAMVARRDTLFIAAAAVAPERGISLFRRAGGRWSERTVPTDGFRLYVELAATAGELVLLSVGLHRGTTAVVAQSSLDGGESWSEPVIVEPLGGSQNAGAPTLIPQQDGTLLGIWSRSPVAAPTSDAVVVASRAAAGDWVLRDRRAVPGLFWGLWVTPAPDGIHAVIRRADNGALHYLGWSPGRWCDGTLPDAEDGLPNPAWNEGVPGELDVYWGEITRLSLPLMKRRRYAVCCH
jgi:hypothetical protein